MLNNLIFGLTQFLVFVFNWLLFKLYGIWGLVNKNQQKINQTKQIVMRNFQETTAKQFVLAKFQPGNILLINRYNKKAFNYFQIKSSQPASQQLNHPYLLRPLFYGTGLLYPKGQSNMKIEVQNRKRAFNKQFFSQEELVNTFVPLFECLEYLHKNKIVHGQVHPESIVLMDGQIKLRDWLIQIHENSFYLEAQKKNKTHADDFIALGQILTQCSTLRKSAEPFQEKDVDLAIESIIDFYDKNFVYAVLILLKKKEQFFKDIVSLMSNKNKNLLQNIELNNLYSKIKSEKANKAIKLQPIEKLANIMQTPKKSENILIQSSPNKKFNITHTSKKSTHRTDDTQNKKVFNEEVKKRQIQKITKIIERSNAFVNELMARKNNNEFGALKSSNEYNGAKNSEANNQQQVLKKISGKNNINLGLTLSNMSMYAVEPVKKLKQTTGITFSPSKRMRTISRKK